MYRAVVFDLDGTFIDSTEAIVASFFHAFDTLGEPRPPRDAIVASIGHILEDQFALFTQTDPHRCAAIYREYYGQICNEVTTLMPGAQSAVARLSAAGLGLGFATSKRRAFAEQILAHLGVLDSFTARVGPDDVARPKPDPECVHRALEQLGVAAAEAVFIGDTLFDLDACAAAGVDCIAVTTGYDTRETLEGRGPLAVVDSLDEVTALVLARSAAA